MMTRLSEDQILMANIEGVFIEGEPAYIPKEIAYETLKKRHLQDFGYDAKAWRKYLRQKSQFSQESHRRPNLARLILALIGGKRHDHH
jgi:hypothetical protein